MKRFQMKNMFGCLAALLLSAGQCGQPSDTITVLVSVNGVVPSMKSLQVSATLNDQPAMEPYEEAQNLRQFAVQLPNSAMSHGTLALQIYGLDGERCRLMNGASGITISADKMFYESTVELLPQTRSCPPVLNKVTPPMGSTAGETLVLEGKNFGLGTSVTIDGTPMMVTGASEQSLSVKLPAKPGAFGKVDVLVRNPDGQQMVRGDLFGYRSAQFNLPGEILAVGSSPWAVATGDFNGDQLPDIAVANFGPNNVSVLLADAKGGFKPAVNFATGISPLSVVVADVNADQKLDIITANRDSNDITVLLGNGAGGFGLAQSYPVGSSAYSVAVADFNQDKRLDVVVATSGPNTVNVLLGNGAGGFGAAQPFATGTSPQSVAVGDFNGDQKTDFVAANRGSNNLSVFLGNGMGGFEAARTFSTGTEPTAVVVQDVNGI